MMNATLLGETHIPLERVIGRKGRVPSADAAKTDRHQKAPAKRPRRRLFDQPLLGAGLLNPKTSSLSLAVLARAAASSGKRLILEIRDDQPVKVIRTYTMGI